MNKGDYIQFIDNNGEPAEGVIVSLHKSKAKHVVNRGGYVELVTILKSNGRLTEMVIADWHMFEVISKGEC